MAASAFQVNKRRFVLPPGFSAEFLFQFRDAPEQFGQMLNGDKLALVVALAFAALTIHQEMRQPTAHDFAALDNIVLR